ncbi:MAG: protoheme IX farnesyltransferase [Parcubacteria group bacterium 21-54-25]|nr:MAG: protoheme IX farnesyltransferase [Parcubacteria group bacterium 21-54-25]HQU07973.1 heme o synthase [Candidatus Paceibacterota bacterium]
MQPATNISFVTERPSFSATLKTYYELTKPGIVYGNAITATAGFFLASAGHPHIGLLLLAMVGGLSLTIASGCVFNNYLDRDIDCQMARTQERPFARGTIATPTALIYGALLGIGGLSILFWYVNPLAGACALFGFVVYVFVYSMWAKRHTHYAMQLGAIAGAMPPVVGYVAVTHQLDIAALMLFLLLFSWQIPHFFAIALYRIDDYRSADIPVLPAQRTLRETQIHMLLYLIVFIFTAYAFFMLGNTGIGYALGVLPLGGLWLWLAVSGFTTHDTKRWARYMFLVSLIVLLGVSAGLSLDARTPPAHAAALLGLT